MESWELITTSDQGLNLWDLLMEEGQPYQLIAGETELLKTFELNLLR